MRNKTSNIYTEWLPLIESQPDNKAGIVFKSILKYQNGEDVVCDNPVWLFIKSKLDDYNNKGLELSKTNSINAKKRWNKRNATACGGINRNANDAIKEKKRKEKKIKENKINVSRTHSDECIQCCDFLANIIKTKKNINPKTGKWKDDIDKLNRIDGVSWERIIKGLQWYQDNIGGQYIPVILSGKSLREKFIKIENAIGRGKSVKPFSKAQKTQDTKKAILNFVRGDKHVE